MNLIDLFLDAANALRFRYKPAEAYRYGLPVFIAVLLAVGVVTATGISAWLGNSTAAICFSLVSAVGRWLVLTRAMTTVMRYFGSPRIPFLGYTLATEALQIPGVLLFYLPPGWGVPVLVWSIWIFWAQAFGFMQISGQNANKVLLGYCLYFICIVLLTALMFALFVSAGWLDAEQIIQRLNELKAQQP